MADYLAQRIIDGALDYSAVIQKFPSLKEKIDAYLKAHGGAKYIKS